MNDLSLIGSWWSHSLHTEFLVCGIFRLPECSTVHSRRPHLVQVSIKANPLGLFLLCLHLFVYLFCLILPGSLQLCPVLAFFPSSVSCMRSCQQKLHSFSLICNNALCFFWVLRACWLPSERGNDLSGSAFISKWSDVMWDCENHCTRGVQCSLQPQGIAAGRSLSLWLSEL